MPGRRCRGLRRRSGYWPDQASIIPCGPEIIQDRHSGNTVTRIVLGEGRGAIRRGCDLLQSVPEDGDFLRIGPVARGEVGDIALLSGG